MIYCYFHLSMYKYPSFISPSETNSSFPTPFLPFLYTYKNLCVRDSTTKAWFYPQAAHCLVRGR